MKSLEFVSKRIYWYSVSMKSFGSVRGVGLLLFAATVCVSGAGSVFADDRYPQWVGSVDSATITVDNTLGTFKDCTQKQINVVLMNRKPDEPYSRETTACVYQNADLEVADFYALNGQVGMAIKRTSDAVFTHLHNKEDSYNATKDTLIYQTGPGTKLVVVKDLSNNIILSEDNNGELTRYSIRQNAEQSLLMRGNDPRAFYEVTHHTLSANGRYVATYVDYEGIVRIDLETGERTSIYKKKGSWLSGPRNIYPAAISDDGQYILLGPSFKMIEMYDCGEEFTGSFEPGGDWCIAGDYNQGIYELLGYSYTISAARFTNNGFSVEINTELIRGGTVYYGDGLPRHINVSVTGGMRTPRLNYLALGDSFSSGEGDIDNDGFWYIDGTDQRDQCHISLRSYPYLLKQNWGIDNASMKSITCSGAKVEPDYFGGDEYIGQRGELKNKTNEEKQTFRAAALDNFTPGIVQQIDFVEKYKPKTLTLTAGGNDVGFGSILAYCASPMEIESSRSLEGYTTCAHANDPQIAANLRKTIDDIRQPLTNLINTIKELSPQTKVYLIGYPQFVAQDAVAIPLLRANFNFS